MTADTAALCLGRGPSQPGPARSERLKSNDSECIDADLNSHRMVAAV
jgi:hypothetical protein